MISLEYSSISPLGLQIADIWPSVLRQWGRGKVAIILQTIFSSAFSVLIFSIEILLKFIRNPPLILSIDLENVSVANRWHAVTWTIDGLDYWYLYASLRVDEWINCMQLTVLRSGKLHWIPSYVRKERFTVKLTLIG